MIKVKCTECQTTWFSDEPILENKCSQDETHVVKETKQLTADDYMELWGMDLENENRHSLGDMPSYILSILTKELDKTKENKLAILRIMRTFYQHRLGM